MQQLGAAGETQRVRERHRDSFLAYARRRESELATDRIPEATTRLVPPGRRIRHDDVGVTCYGDGRDIRARRGIVALPPALAGHIDYDPPLSADRDQLTQRMPQAAS